MTTRAKNRKTFKWPLLLTQWPNFKIISQKCSSYAPLPKLPLEVKIKKTHFKTTQTTRWMVGFQYYNFSEMFFGWPFTKIARIDQLHWTERPPGLKIRNLKTTTPPWLMAQFQNNFTEMISLCLFTNTAKMVLLCWTKWPTYVKIHVEKKTFTKIARTVLLHITKWLPELKIEKSLNNIS